MKLVRRRTDCRACSKRNLVRILDLGKTPPANAFLKKPQKQALYPLRVNWCKDCNMVQLAHIVDPKLLFENYVYVSSTSPVFVGHFEDLSKKIIKQLRLKKNSLVVDIGSNDGILLKPFQKRGMRVLGIEPAKNIAKRASKDGIPTIADFFSVNLAKKVVSKFGQADLVTATNVFAHIDDLDEVVAGIKLLLKPEGIFLIEVAYLKDFITKNLFDTVYHEHLCYWAVRPMKVLAQRLGLKIFDVNHVPTHGGSIRGMMKLKGAKRPVTNSVASFVLREKRLSLNKLTPYLALAKRIEKNRVALNKLLAKLKQRGKRVIGYGAPAKATTLLSYFGIDNQILDFIVDDSPYKQGLYTPGTHIPVLAAEQMYKTKPDYMVILAWNFADSIIKAHKDFGGRFIIPIPKLEVV